MRKSENWVIGIDLGGTKLDVARIDLEGAVRDSMRMATRVEAGHTGIELDIIKAVEALQGRAGSAPAGVGVGIAGQIDGDAGVVHFSPNLNWHEVPLRADLERSLGIPTVVTNDVRAITWGEWTYGAGSGFSDIVCLYVGTGIGGGVVAGGRILPGCTNAAGELGHIVVDMNGPLCTCGNHGCLEAIAGGWAIAQRARQAVKMDPETGRKLIELAGDPCAITAETVGRASREHDAVSLKILDAVGQALTAGCVSVVNAFNPRRLILGGGVIDGVPELIDRIRQGVIRFGLPAATAALEVVPGALGRSAGVLGAASIAMRVFGNKRSKAGCSDHPCQRVSE
jgi:glucokinase